jgi:hypothetical protein
MSTLSDISNDMMSLRNFIMRKCMRLSLQHNVRVFFSVEAYGRTLIYSSESDYKSHLQRIYNSKRKTKVYNNQDYTRLLSSEGKNKSENFHEKNEEEFYEIEEEPENYELKKTPIKSSASEEKMRKKFIKCFVKKVNEIIPDSYVEPNIKAAIERKFPLFISNGKSKKSEEKRNQSKKGKRKFHKLSSISKEENQCPSNKSLQIEQENSFNENDTRAKDNLIVNEKPAFSLSKQTANFNLFNSNKNNNSYSISGIKNILQENYDDYSEMSENLKKSEKNISLEKIENLQD